METAVAVEVSAVEVRDRLLGFVDGVAARLPLRRQRENALVYVRGLIEHGGRKSLQPTLFRLEESPARYESVQQFLADSPWDPRLLIRACAERVAPQIGVVAWIVDDTGIVKDGKHSPGVKRQYSGTLGKIGNCQITVSVLPIGTLWQALIIVAAVITIAVLSFFGLYVTALAGVKIPSLAFSSAGGAPTPTPMPPAGH